MSRTAIIAGVGPGLGAALARRFVKEGCRVGLFSRSRYCAELAEELRRGGGDALGVPTDITVPQQVSAGFRQIRERYGPVTVLVNHAGHAAWKGLFDLSPAEFEQGWRVNAYGAFLCTREVVPEMLQAGGGAILFTGATSSVRGRADALAFSSAKFAARGLADALARELWPKGIHVAHVVIDGVIDTPHVREVYQPKPDEPLLAPDAIANVYWHLIEQDRSAWTLELDVRPSREEFFV